MSHRIRKLCWGAFLIALLGGRTPCRADGGFVSQLGLDIWEPSQLALILYDPEAQREEMIIQVGFQSMSADFAWIVPVPGVPELTAEENTPFYELSRLTRPLERDRGLDCGCSDTERPVDYGADNQEDVTVLDDQAVGVFHALTLEASDAGALADSLGAWGYLHEENEEQVVSSLQHYVAKSWYFVAMKIDSADARAEYQNNYYYGGLQPVRFAFVTDAVVYPMHISAISAVANTDVLLYVCADHRMTFDGASTEYANWFSESELDAVRKSYTTLPALLAQPCFLTKLRRTFRPQEMTEDIYLERAESDREYRQIRYSGVPAAEGLLFVILGILLTLARRRRLPTRG